MSLHFSMRWWLRTGVRQGLILVAVAMATACQSAQCGEGFELVDGECEPEPTCGPCGENEFCDTSPSPDDCACLPGYEGLPCAFVGLIEDPGFFTNDIDVGPWKDDGHKGATVLRFAPGDLDRGEGALDDQVLCNAGSLLQRVSMPAWDLADRFVVEVNYIAEDVHGLGIGFDRAWKRLPSTGSTWSSESFCLGQGSYGESPFSEVEVRISASERHENCDDPDPGSRIRVDRFTIRPAGESECDLGPGEVRNGSAEQGAGGWGFTMEEDAVAEFAPGEGRDGTDGVRIARGAGDTGRATMTTEISVPAPATVASPALEFWWRGSSEALFDVDLGTFVDLGDRGRHVDTLAGTESPLNRIYCLPPWTHGSELELSFSLPESNSAEVELVIDDVGITTDPDCGSDEDLLDPGFESAPNEWFGASVSSSFEAVILQSDADLALTGQGLMELRYDENAGVKLGMETYVFVPESTDDEGPAVTFHSKSPATPSTDVRWALGLSETPSEPVKTEVDWEPNEACLPAQWANRWYRLVVQVELQQSPERLESILLDDFFLGTSSSCRPQ
jgi:hypothetical protein